MSEALKTLTCLLVLSQLVGSLKGVGLFLRREVLHNSSQAMKLGIPALLYLIQVNIKGTMMCTGQSAYMGSFRTTCNM
jgi:hypothetical protein